MDKQDLDVLLQARTSELQHEYENLVRSLDAAYEAVKAIGRDIAENRAEARRLFDTRLKLARGDDLEAVLRLCSASNGDANTTTINNNNVNRVNGRKLNVNDGNVSEQMPAGMVRLYVQQSDATKQQQHVSVEQQPRVVTVTSNEAPPRLRSMKPIHTFDTASLLIEQLQQQQQHEQPHYSPVYVGDDHSYAVNEEEEEDLPEHQLMLEERLMIADTHGDTKRRGGRDNIVAGVDLSIVKTECAENSMEEQNPLADHQTTIVQPVTLAKNPKIINKRSPNKLRKLMEEDDNDELVRKRKQTRERMRRWRAKKKMEEINAKQPYKYKLVIAKTA